MAGSMSVGDEVRFRSSPTVIHTGPAPVTASAWAGGVGGVGGMGARLQAATNKHGLLELELSGRGLLTVPAEVFAMLRIEALKLNNNNLHVLEPAISRLHQLRVLHVQHNKLVSLPDTLCNCTHLLELDASSNRLSGLSQHIPLLRHLKILRLSNNQFSALPHQLCSLKALRVLDVSGNQLWHLPHTFNQLINIHYLNLACNQFQQLPITVCSLKNLTVLNLHGNQLHSLPPDFEQLAKLQELSLAANQLDSMPYAICQLKQLHTLDLSNNKLRSLPVRMSRLAKLRILSAHTNQLVAIPNHLEHIEYLNLTENRLRNFSVANMKKLKHLAAGHNQLENMPLGVYNLANLEVLKLNDNELSYVSQDIELLKKLRTFDLGNNRLTSLPQVINELEQMHTFNIRGNPIEAKPLHSRQRGGKERANGWGGMRARDILYPDPKYPPPITLLHPGYAIPNGYMASPQLSSPKKLFAKKPQKSKDVKTKRKSGFGTKTKSTQHIATSRNTGTQYTPKSSVKIREQPPLESRRETMATLFPPPQPHSRSPSPRPTPQTPRTIPPTPRHENTKSLKSTNGTLARSMANLSVNPDMYGNPLAHSEIAYPMQGLSSTSMPNLSNPEQIEWELLGPAMHRRGSERSLAVTVGADTIGDGLSLGEEDYDFQPTTVQDERLLGLCSHVEQMLNQQLLSPANSQQQSLPKGIFSKRMNEFGTLRTLNGLLRRPGTRHKSRPPHQRLSQGLLLQHQHTASSSYSPRHRHPRREVASSSPDTFHVGAAGGVFRSAMDMSISVYFPPNTLPAPITITMQIEKFSVESLRMVQHNAPLTENLLAVGDIVNIIQSEDYAFREQVTVTVPMPAAPVRQQEAGGGKLHILEYLSHEGRLSCSPYTGTFTLQHGARYIALKTWHFSGKGAIFTKSKCRYKACKSMDAFLQHLYL